MTTPDLRPGADTGREVSQPTVNSENTLSGLRVTSTPAPRTYVGAPIGEGLDAPPPRVYMRPHVLQGLLLIEVAILFALMCLEGALFVVFWVVRAYANALLANPPDQDVTVAAHRIGIGDTVMVEDLKTVRLPAAFKPDGVIDNPLEIIGRAAMEPILEGELIRGERLAPIERGTGLTAILPNGMRAAALVLDGAATVSHEILPSDHVDIISTLYDTDGHPTETETLLQGVKVLAVETHLDPLRSKSQREWQQITFALVPEDAQRLAHATRVGRVHLAMRSPIDFEEERVTPVTTATLVDPAPEPEPPVEPAPARTVVPPGSSW